MTTNNLEISKGDLIKYYDYYIRLLMSYFCVEPFTSPNVDLLVSQRRLTHQFISALLACGFPTDTPILIHAYDWLIDSRYTEDKEESLYIVPEKIEAAIELGRSNDDFCERAIKLLLRTRRTPTIYDIPNEEPKNFTSLWIAKILLQHPENKKYKSFIQETLNAFLKSQAIRAREYSLLYMLCSQFWGDAFTSSKEAIEIEDKLVDFCYEGLIDIPISLQYIVQDLVAFGITPDQTSGIENDLFTSLISTCYFITNMQLTRTQLPDKLQKAVNLSIKTVFGILSRDLHALSRVYKDPYKQIMIISRSLIALSLSTGDEVGKLVLPDLLKELVELDKQKMDLRHESEKKHLKDVIRNWINIDWNENDQWQLGGGYSHAKVVRIKPKIFLPTDAIDESSIPLITNASIIIKYGRKVELDLERENFLCIPPEYRSNFASVPSTTLHEIVENEPIEYLVIEDLIGYKTLQEYLQSKDLDFLNVLGNRIIDFLKCIYEIPPIKTETTGFIWQNYLSPMNKSLGSIIILQRRTNKSQEISNAALDHIHSLTKQSCDLDNFVPTIMHGDLNIRNIMIHGKARVGSELRFKLIDLDKFSRCGDLAFDIGEFICDTLTVFNNHSNYNIINNICTKVNRTFTKFADSIKDIQYPIRYKLALARSYLKVSELKTREFQGRSILDPLGERKAMAIVDDISPNIKKAEELLAEAMTML